jgi:hypothetical protein
MRFVRILLVAAAIYAGIGAMMFALQRSLLYFPDPTPMDPARAGLPQAASETVATADGERIVLWWVAPRDATKPVYLYLHGNGANMMVRGQRFARLISDGAGLMAVSWRGYGGSSGSPTEAGLTLDAEAAYAALAGRVPPARIVVFGESLGTAVATRVAAERPVAALVLDSAFTSAVDIGARAYPFLPVRQLMLDRFEAELAAPRVRAPVFQTHCRGDPVTPLDLAERQHALFAGRKRFVGLEGRCHPAPIERFEWDLRAFLARPG